MQSQREMLHIISEKITRISEDFVQARLECFCFYKMSVIIFLFFVNFCENINV